MMKRVDSRTKKDDYDEEEPKLEDCDAAEMILTYIFRKLHSRSTETLLFIEGRSTLSTKLRLPMFKGDAFGVYSDV